MKRSFTSLTDVTLITAVVQHGYGEVISESLLEVGIQGFTSHAAMGVGIRERLGAFGVAVDAERDVVNVMVSSDEVDRLFERIFLAGKLDVPGMGFMYATPLMQAATYVPPSILSKYVGK
ncbi:MAG: P-II family nitrogen regulator [Bacteroidetes bacterium]|jgi:nitrogen regulatory protein P-II 1|nr:P-II family nitrogen regulator [Bacteroidota bacterium]